MVIPKLNQSKASVPWPRLVRNGSFFALTPKLYYLIPAYLHELKNNNTLKKEQVKTFKNELQFRRKYLTKVEKSSKIGQGKKNLISTFRSFLTAIAKVPFLGGRLGTGLCLNPNVRFFQYFLFS